MDDRGRSSSSKKADVNPVKWQFRFFPPFCPEGIVPPNQIVTDTNSNGIVTDRMMRCYSVLFNTRIEGGNSKVNTYEDQNKGY